MENDNYKKWFNSRLFVMENRPLQFYLLGYNQMECRDIAGIVEAHGGKLSAVSGGSVVFSEPHRCNDYNGDVYHIKCLYDSIMTDHFQNISYYRLVCTSQKLSSIPITTEPLPPDNPLPNTASFPKSLKCKEEPLSDIEDTDAKGSDVKIQDFLDSTKDLKYFRFAPDALTHSGSDCFPPTLSNPEPNEAGSKTNMLPSTESSTERLQSHSENLENSEDDSCSAARTRPYLPQPKSSDVSESISIDEHFTKNFTKIPVKRKRRRESEAVLEANIIASRRNVRRQNYEECPSDGSSSSGDERMDSKCDTLARSLDFSDLVSIGANIAQKLMKSRRKRKRMEDEEVTEKNIVPSRRKVRRQNYEEIPTDSSSDEKPDTDCDSQKAKKICDIRRYFKPISKEDEKPEVERSTSLPRFGRGVFRDGAVVRVLLDRQLPPYPHPPGPKAASPTEQEHQQERLHEDRPVEPGGGEAPKVEEPENLPSREKNVRKTEDNVPEKVPKKEDITRSPVFRHRSARRRSRGGTRRIREGEKSESLSPGRGIHPEPEVTGRSPGNRHLLIRGRKRLTQSLLRRRYYR